MTYKLLYISSNNYDEYNNAVSFETSINSIDKKDDKPITPSEESTSDSVSSVEEATDKDGWINRWY